MKSQSILIAVEEGSTGLALILSGYLQFYGDQNLHIYCNRTAGDDVLLPELVLAEDGIVQYAYEKAGPATKQDLTIFINPPTPKLDRPGSGVKTLLIDTSHIASGNGSDIEEYRKIREHIKRYAIECIGDLRISSLQNT